MPMNENGKIFLCHRGYQKVFIDENGILVVEETKAPGSDGWEFTPLMELLYSHGYRYMNDHIASRFIFSFIGKSLAEFEEEIQKRVQKDATVRAKRAQDRKKWAAHVETMSNMLIGITSVDLFETGFHVWVLLNSQNTYQQQRDYVQARNKDIIQFISSELQAAKRRDWKRVAMLMPFAGLSSVVLTKRNTVQYTYELKERIQDILKEE